MHEARGAVGLSPEYNMSVQHYVQCLLAMSFLVDGKMPIATADSVLSPRHQTRNVMLPASGALICTGRITASTSSRYSLLYSP